jgi:hypothetical protein
MNHLQLRILAGWLLMSSAAHAQILYGSLVGNVRDASDAAVAGAGVIITNAQTNQTRQAATNDFGAYSLPTLEPGTYTVRVSKPGFSTFNQTDVVVSINNVTRVDVKLSLGAVTETVNVTGQTAALQTDRSEVRAEVTSTSLQNLPVAIGRNYQQLFRTIPGFRPPSNAHSVPTNPARALTFNVNGVSYSINNTRIDGAASNSPWLPHISAFVPTLEAVETVNVVTNSFDAEQGLAGGAAVNVQIKSGTNSLHGGVFESHTDNHLKAKPFFLPVGQDIPKLVNNEFGAAVGGPIKHDKLFFFMSYEGNLNRELATRFGTVPTAKIKSGDMSDSSRPIYDPESDPTGANRTVFPNNLVPMNRQSAIARKLADLTPLPNLDLLTNNYYAATSYLYDRHRADTKLNWNILPKWTAFGRFSINHYDMNNPEMFGAIGGPAISSAGSNAGVGTGNTFSFTGATTYVFTPTLVLDANVGWTRMDTSVEQSRLDENLGRDFLGIPGVNGTRRFEGGWPTFAVSNYTNIGVNDNFMPYYRSDPQYSVVANFNWTKGAHEIRFGTELYFTGMNQLQPEATGNLYGAQGGFGFGTGPTQTAGGPSGNMYNSYATFLMGLPTDGGKVVLTPENGFTTRQKNYTFYARDRWNVSSKLTLSYGLRWEYYPFPTRADRGLEWYDGSVNKMLVCGAGSIPKDCGVHVSKKLFAPRIGIAYRATPTFVFRAGYGITYDPFSLQRPFRTNFPILLIQNITTDSLGYIGKLSDGLPAVQAPNIGSGVLDVPGTFAVVSTPKDFNRGYIQSWNVTVQKQLPGDFTVQAGYVATRSTRQLGYLDVNSGQVIGAGNAGRPLQAKFGRTAATTLVTPLGTTHYDSLQATVQRRFSKGLQIEGSYTWSKVIGLAINSDSGPNFVQALPYFDMNRVVADYDRTHMLHISQIWELPFGKGHRLAPGGVAASVLGGWQMSQLWSFYTGTPFSVSASGTSLNLPNSTQRADQIKPSVDILGNAGRGMWYFDPLAFAPVTDKRFGTAGYRSLRGPGLVDWDFGIHRTFRVTERVSAQFKAEIFNFTNTPHFANPGGNVSNMDLTGGVVKTNGFAEITGVTNLARDGIDERQFRLGLHFKF